MIGFFCGLVVGIIAASILCYIIIQPKLKYQYSINQDLIQQEKRIKDNIAQGQLKIDALDAEQLDLQIEVEKLKTKQIDLKCQIAEDIGRKESLLQSIKDIENEAKTATNAIYEKNVTQMSEELDQSAMRLSQQYQAAKESYEAEYLSILADLSSDISQELQEKKEMLAQARLTLDELAAKITSAVAASKRALEMEEETSFYRLNISEQDIAEIKKLKEIIPYLKDQEALNKVIWKVYYEKATNDMIGRIIGQDRKIGIYKITDLSNQKCYVGQSNDIASRWKQHIKRGLGAESPTRNKLYPVMAEKGVENFTFELIEECSVSLLDEREDFWQDYFHAKTFGYSIK